MTSAQDMFGEMRSLLERRDTSHALVRILDNAQALTPELYDEVWRPYLDTALSGWPTPPMFIADSLGDLVRITTLVPQNHCTFGLR